jgi:hypothetical protein
MCKRQSQQSKIYQSANTRVTGTYFIQHEKLDSGQVDSLHGNQVVETTRRGNNAVHTLGHGGNLWILGGAAITAHAANTQASAKLDRLVQYLRRQFPRRGQDEQLRRGSRGRSRSGRFGL